jgi:hypothetical protein
LLGHHFLWTPPQPEARDIFPPSDFRVVRDGGGTLGLSGSVAAIVTILLLILRRRQSSESVTRGFAGTAGEENTTIAASLTKGGIALVSLSLALCLSAPPPDGVPLVIFFGMALNTPYDSALPMPILAVGLLAFYFINVFLLMHAVLWLSRGPIRK